MSFYVFALLSIIRTSKYMDNILLYQPSCSLLKRLIPKYWYIQLKFNHSVYISMALCKTAVTPLLMHWSYCSLALSHRFHIQTVSNVKFIESNGLVFRDVKFQRDDVIDIEI